MKPVKLVKREGVYHLRRVVPKRYASVEFRKIVWISLRTDSESLALHKAAQTWGEMLEAWEARLAGHTEDAEKRFEAARDLAARLGHRYLPASKVAKLPEEEFIGRLRAALGSNSHPTSTRALLGGVEEPKITVSRALELFWSLAADRTAGMNARQVSHWKRPRKRAIANFIATVGDKELAGLTADDMLEYREWWVGRATSGEIKASSANQEIGLVLNTLKTVNMLKRLGIELPLADLRLKRDQKDQHWPPFSDEWIRTKILAPGALDGLHPEANAIVRALINTGCRPSELIGILPGQIHLNAPVPYVSIEPVDRKLKTPSSKREVPLVGVSLAAMKEYPGGFPKYRNSSKWSMEINSYLRENGLLETPRHVLYSLRHSFEDRMLAAGVDERIRRDLFGHALNRQRYGIGATLLHKQKIIQATAF